MKEEEDKHKNELEVINFWKKNNIYKRAIELRKNGPKFYFCDGPPYATGEIHLGHVWNKSLKDAYCRYKMMQGYNVYVRAGFDTHGLPIETKVEKELGIKNKKEIEELGIEKFVKECKKFASHYIKIIIDQFVRFGIWQDFDDPYITYKDEYIEKCWGTIKKAYEKNLLVNDFYVVPYCPRCQTPMANYELEYEDMEDPSIYIKFKVIGKENEYLIIWTTTPWTLVGNVAVMAHPIYRYIKVKVGEEIWIVAKDCWDRVQKDINVSGTIIEEFAGKELTKVKYVHPLAEEVPIQNYEHSVVMSEEFVTTEEGTGLVHCAPGHGPEDYIIGKRYELPIFSPIGADAKYTKEAGEYEGIEILKANEVIIKRLKEKKILLHSSKIIHRYPKCWRCKTKLIHLASLQWFIKITNIKDKMKSENMKVRWIPQFAGIWFENFLDNARDWCISRQRYWGIPLPIWKCKNCEKIKVIGSKDELKEDVELHRPYVDKIKLKCECGREMERLPDILDVWFDSGNAVWAGLRKGEEKLYPADMIIEGKDQIRGWFYSLLGSGIILNEEVPYRSVIMHGYVVDEKGREMHKSLGNYVPVEEILKKYSADTIRLWTISNVTWEDLKLNWKEINDAQKDLIILLNIGNYIDRFYKEEKKGEKREKKEGEVIIENIEDIWINSKINSIIKKCTKEMEEGEAHNAIKDLRKFYVEDISRFYMKLIKKREDLDILHNVYLTTLKLLSPFVPLTTESLYKKIYEKKDSKEYKESIFFYEWPKADESQINQLLEKQMETIKEIIDACNNIRAEAEIGLRWPLEEVIIATKSIEIRESITVLNEILKKMTNIKNVNITDAIEVEIDEKAKNELGKEIYNKILELKKENEEKFLRGILTVEEKNEKEGGKEINFSKYLKVTKVGYKSKIMPWGVILLKTKIEKDLLVEGMANELRRRIQMMRKELNLVEKDKINVYITASKEFEETIAPLIENLKKDVNAKEIHFKSGGKEKKKWEIEEEKITIGIDVLN